MKNYQYLFLLMLFASFSAVMAQKTNRLDKSGQRRGKWVTYSDSARKIKLFEGRFRKGVAVGKASYYNANGILDRKEQSRFGILKTVNYYPNGKIRSKGKARIEILPDKIHYYYFGRWKYYSEEGRLIKYLHYEKGNLVKTESAIKKQKQDTLDKTWVTLENTFFTKNETLIGDVNKSLLKLRQAEKLREQIFLKDSLTFYKAFSLLDKYGYPAVLIYGEPCNSPFFILSYAPLKFREKYITLLSKAADNGDLSWASLAHYIDKVKIAQTGLQIYKTHYYFNKDMKIVYYPVADSLNLDIRRKQAGFKD